MRLLDYLKAKTRPPARVEVYVFPDKRRIERAHSEARRKERDSAEFEQYRQRELRRYANRPQVVITISESDK